MKTLKPTLHTKLALAALALASTCSLMFTAGNALATSYGTNITIPDGVPGTGGVQTGLENNEAEPEMTQNQSWDLEGFFLDKKATGTNLSIVGGYNFYTGNQNLYAGDIFIDTDGNAVRSPNIIPNLTKDPRQKILNSSVRYDYVLDIDWANATAAGGSYNIVQLTGTSTLTDTQYGLQHNAPSNPWQYITTDGTNATDTIVYRGTFNTHGKASQTDTGFDKWVGGGEDNHYVATFDLTSISSKLYGAYFHNTMECGNDNLIGYAPVPEPATMLLFGTGIAGLAGIVRRRRMHN